MKEEKRKKEKEKELQRKQDPVCLRELFADTFGIIYGPWEELNKELVNKLIFH